MQTISERILHYMAEKNISYSRLSELTGITKSSLQRYATGTTSKIPIDAIASIESALHLKKGTLMGWESEDDSIASDLKTALMMQNVENAIRQQEANTYTIHGSNGKGTVFTTSDVPTNKFFLIGNGKVRELTQAQHTVLQSVLDAMSNE